VVDRWWTTLPAGALRPQLLHAMVTPSGTLDQKIPPPRGHSGANPVGLSLPV
jgi:hypothetical protein